MSIPPRLNSTQDKFGLAHWMQRVLGELHSAAAELAPDAVHDLRVALRRCRSIAEGIRTVDSHPAWKQMRKSAKAVFSRLGDLRDTQVMIEWVEKLAAADDPVRAQMLGFLRLAEQRQKQEALAALHEFDIKQWNGWTKLLPGRASRLPIEGAVFQHLALERWLGARELHQRALRNRSHAAFHNLRIGIKKFRYTVENFLPQRHQAWGNDLKALQDTLGEYHDFSVLWETAVRAGALADPEARARWRALLNAEGEKRVAAYREKMVGPQSLWPVWRAALPRDKELERAGMAKLHAWASYLDSDAARTRRVSRLAMQLYDGLYSARIAGANGRARQVLQLAAMLHNVGGSKPKKSYRLVSKVAPPLNLSQADLQLAATVVRYHRGALPDGQKSYQQLARADRAMMMLLAGILRLANALEAAGPVSRLNVRVTPEVIHVEADVSVVPAARKLAAERALLEIACKRAVMIRAAAQKTVRAAAGR